MHEIKEQVYDSGRLWCDPEFPADDSSLYLDPMKRPAYDAENIDWKRPEEIYIP